MILKINLKSSIKPNLLRGRDGKPLVEIIAKLPLGRRYLYLKEVA